MSLTLDDTIAALGSPPGPGARGIVRVSGPGVRESLSALFASRDAADWQAARTAHRVPGVLRLPSLRVPVPVDLYFWPTPRSYTGQRMAELHLAGSPPLLEAVLAALCDGGVRPARPGEFTLRAFLAGRVDLVQAEAVLGVIDAHDHRELETALRQLAGGLSGRIGQVRGDLLDLLADLEAGLDFVEEDIEFVGPSELMRRLTAAVESLGELCAQASSRMQTTGRPRVVLAGLPNAGKSSLLNRLVGRDAALVSEIQGTTRDYLAAELDWDGTAVELVDTAGWEFVVDPLTHQAQTLRGEQLERADLVLFCTPADAGPDAVIASDRCIDQLRRQGRAVLRVRTKSDLAVGQAFQPDIRSGTRFDSSCQAGKPDLRAIAVSAHSGSGLAELAEAAAASLSAAQPGGRQLLGTTAARCRESLAAAVTSLQRARDAAELETGDELIALELREALDHLGRIVGMVYTDDVLDRLFSRFCIGK